MAALGLIDPLSNLKKHRVYLFSGKLDVTVRPIAVYKLEQMEIDLGVTQIKTQYEIYAAHGQPTQNYGLPCYLEFPPFILKCEYDGAGEALKFLYGSYIKNPAGTANPNSFVELAIDKFLPSGSTASELSFSETWYLYIPQSCRNSTCALHVAIHGCLSGGALVGEVYRDHSGYNEWAETNLIVILYPQVVSSLENPINPQGCWDWWGYTDQNYANKNGKQLVTVNNVVNFILSGKLN